MAARVTYHIEAPVQEVFEFFLEPNADVQYGPFTQMKVDESHRTKEGVGTFMSWSVKMAGIPVSGFDVVTECVRNRHITERSSNPMVGTWTYDFAKEGTGTRLTMEHHQQAPWTWPPLSQVTDFATRRMSRGYVDAVKVRLEHDAATTAERKPRAVKTRKPAAGG